MQVIGLLKLKDSAEKRLGLLTPYDHVAYYGTLEAMSRARMQGTHTQTSELLLAAMNHTTTLSANVHPLTRDKIRVKLDMRAGVLLVD